MLLQKNFIYSKGTLLARWNEDMIFCELQQHLLEADHVVMLVELLVLPKVHQSPYPVAWGILIPSKVALDKLLPVQLYKVPKWKRRTIKVHIQSDPYTVYNIPLLYH